MKNLQKANIIRIIIAIVIVLIISNWFISKNRTALPAGSTGYQNSSNNTNTGTSKADGLSVASKCGFKITSPASGAAVSFPLTVKGTISHTDAQMKTGCSWNEINQRAGTAQLFYYVNNSVWQSQGVAVPILTSGTLVASTSAFSVSLNFLNQGVGLRSGSKMKITFLENEVGITNPKTFDFYVYFK